MAGRTLRCALCDTPIQGPWRYCSETCAWLAPAEREMARAAVILETRKTRKTTKED